MARVHRAYAAPHVNEVDAALALHRAMTHREDNRSALPERHDVPPPLAARPLLCQHELAAGEVPFGTRQQRRDLQREDVLAVDVLVQAVVIAGAVLKDQRCRPALTRGVTALEVLRVLRGIA